LELGKGLEENEKGPWAEIVGSALQSNGKERNEEKGKKGEAPPGGKKKFFIKRKTFRNRRGAPRREIGRKKRASC